MFKKIYSCLGVNWDSSRCLCLLNFTFKKHHTCQISQKKEKAEGRPYSLFSKISLNTPNRYILSCHFLCCLVSGTPFLLFILNYYLLAKKKGLYINDFLSTKSMSPYKFPSLLYFSSVLQLLLLALEI